MATRFFRSPSGRRAQIIHSAPHLYTLIVSRVTSLAPHLIVDYKSSGACFRRMRKYEPVWNEVDYSGNLL